MQSNRNVGGLKTPTLSSPMYPSSPTKSSFGSLKQPQSAYPRSSSPIRSSSSLSTINDNTVAVNVAVRIRPPPEELYTPDGAMPPSAMNTPSKSRAQSSILESSTNNSVTINRKKFQFDNVFDESTTQQGVWNYIGTSASKFVQGYNVTIMAYGQSGSGKSFTMGTTDDPSTVKNPEIMGVTQRAAKEVFNELNRSATSSPDLSGSDIPSSPTISSAPPPRLRPPSINFSVKNRLMVNGADENLDCRPWTVSVSYMEIYNEQLRDLLDPNGASKKMTIREDVKGNIFVQGIKQVVVSDTESLLATLEQGSKARQTNSTAINASSSRSHAIFTIHLIQKQLQHETGIVTTVTSKLNLVDLAGSERLKNTAATNEGRVREGIAINGGLTSLGKVISQLSTTSAGSHISYRDSKLTRALQDSLGGKAITYLIACITTESLYLSETLNTLSYAQRARSIQSSPEIQTMEVSREELIKTVQQLQQELANLKSASPANSPELDSISTFAPSTPTPSISAAIMSPMSESSKDRVSRSTAFQSAVESIISDYELTVKSLQESTRISKETITELNDTLQQTQAELTEAKDANAELSELVESLQQRIDEVLKANDNNNNNNNDDNANDQVMNETKITQLERELLSYRQEHKRHLTESQYLTGQYNNARKEVSKLQREKDELEAKLRRFEMSGMGNMNMFRRRVSVPDVAEEDDTSSVGGDSNGPDTPPSVASKTSEFSFKTNHRRTLSLASQLNNSNEKTPRSERRRSSFFVRASVI